MPRQESQDESILLSFLPSPILPQLSILVHGVLCTKDQDIIQSLATRQGVSKESINAFFLDITRHSSGWLDIEETTDIATLVAGLKSLGYHISS